MLLVVMEGVGGEPGKHGDAGGAGAKLFVGERCQVFEQAPAGEAKSLLGLSDGPGAALGEHLSVGAVYLFPAIVADLLGATLGEEPESLAGVLLPEGHVCEDILDRPFA